MTYGKAYLAAALWLALCSLTTAQLAWAETMTARTVVVMEAHSGQVVENLHGEEPVGPASLAKMMTLYLIFTAVKDGQASWDDKVLISKRAWKMGGSKMFIKAGDRITLDRLAHGIGIVSGNDACIAVAEYLSGSEDGFVQWMNEMAGKLGLERTHFGSATGLPAPRQITDGHDMVVLARALLADFPQVLEILSTRSFTNEGITQRNRNGLLWMDIGVDGMKTGHTEASGYHLVATAQKGNQRFIAGVMGAGSAKAREAIAQRYLMTAFRKYETVSPVVTTESPGEARVWKGAVEQVAVYPAEEVFLTVPRGQKEDITVTLQLAELVAPVTVGQTAGSLQVYLAGKQVRQVALLTGAEVAEGTLWQRLWDSVVMSGRDLMDSMF